MQEDSHWNSLTIKKLSKTFLHSQIILVNTKRKSFKLISKVFICVYNNQLEKLIKKRVLCRRLGMITGRSWSKLHHWTSHATAHRRHLCLRLSAARFRAFDRFIDGQNHAGCLASCLKSIDLNNWGLPDACLQVIGHIFLIDVDAIPYVTCKQKNEILLQFFFFNRIRRYN